MNKTTEHSMQIFFKKEGCEDYFRNVCITERIS